jgi:DNA replication protein DnaD
MSGWIKIHRCITNHWIYTEKRSFSKFEAWIDILMTVNFADAQVLIKGKLYQVKRGQSILSMDSWANRWNWNKSKVRRFMDLLQKDSMIVIKTDTITTQLTVCNYESYQDERHTDKPQTKRKRNTNETQTTPIKEEEEEQEEKKEKVDRFVSPTIQELKTEFPNLDAQRFHDFYSSKGWMIGKNKMKDWKAAARNWLSRDTNNSKPATFVIRNKANLNDD